MLKKIVNKVKTFVEKAKGVMTTVMVAALCGPVYAGVITPAADIDPLKVLGTIAGYLLSILQAVGLIFIVWGGFQFAMSLRDEDAASKHRAILVLVAGIAMVGLKALLKGFGLIV